MITKDEKRKIHKLSKKYQIKRVFLFGSSLDPKKKSRDIDLGIEGIRPKEFFKYYGELLFALSKTVDVIDLSGSSKFIEMIKKEGVLIYG